jgi:hypothetical protein
MPSWKIQSHWDNILRNFAELYGVPLHKILYNSVEFCNSVQHTDYTEAEKGTEFRVDRIL